MEKIEIRYQEASLDNVLQFFADEFKAPAGTKVMKNIDGSTRAEWFVDPMQGKVVFKLFLETE